MRHFILIIFLFLISKAIAAFDIQAEIDPCLSQSNESRRSCEDNCPDDSSLNQKISCIQSCDIFWYANLKTCYQKLADN